MTESIVIAGAARTPMGAFQGDFSSLAAHDLGGAAIRAAVERSGIAPAAVGPPRIARALTAPSMVRPRQRGIERNIWGPPRGRRVGTPCGPRNPRSVTRSRSRNAIQDGAAERGAERAAPDHHRAAGEDGVGGDGVLLVAAVALEGAEIDRALGAAVVYVERVGRGGEVEVEELNAGDVVVPEHRWAQKLPPAPVQED